MSATTPSFPVIREAVAAFPDRAHFRRAVAAMLDGGFARDDLSVLASHEKLPAAETAAEAEGDAATGLPYIAPLTIAGIIAISAGPIAAAVAAVVAAGLGGAALKELLDRHSDAPHRDELVAAFSGGAALLWVRCADSELELRALRILEESGGRQVHIHGRPAEESAGSA
jgi:hypothetical protein